MDIIIADDHLMIREGIKQIFLKMRNMQISAEAETGFEALEYATTLPCDILLIDINMPGLNGIEVLQKIKTEKPSIKVIVFSMFSDKKTVQDAIGYDVDGYILKDDEESVFTDIVKHVAAGHKTFSPKIQSVLFDLAKYSNTSPLDKLTTQEREIFIQLTTGKQRGSIAANLDISLRTVDFHTRNIKDKLGVETLSELINISRENRV